MYAIMDSTYRYLKGFSYNEVSNSLPPSWTVRLSLCEKILVWNSLEGAKINLKYLPPGCEVFELVPRMV